MSFSKQLEKVMDEQGISVTELAERSGVCKLSIQKYLADTSTPQLLTAIDLADTLGVSMDYLCERGQKIEVWTY